MMGKRIGYGGLPAIMLGICLLFAGGCGKGGSREGAEEISGQLPATEQMPEPEQLLESGQMPEPEQFSESGQMSESEQLSVFAQNCEVWRHFQESRYAVFDLDRDGRLELIVSFIQGSGHYSTNAFYQVEGNTVVELEQPTLKEEMGIDEFDLPYYEPTSYRDREAGIIYYAATDMQRGGYGDYGYLDGFFWMEDGMVYHKTVRAMHYWERDEEVVYTYYDGDGFANEISQEEWEQLYVDFTEGMEKEEVEFTWFTLSDQEDGEETILDKLTASYKEGAD